METNVRSPEEALRRATSWSMLVGGGAIIAGAFAIAMPITGALAAALLFGFVALVSGALELGYAIRMRDEQGSFWRFVIALVGLVTGVLVLLRPAAGMLALTFWLGTMVIVRGGMQVALAWEHRSTRVWGWYLFDGIVSLAVGGAIIAGWPRSSVLFLGVWVGVSLIMNGLHRFAIAVVLRKVLPPSSRARPFGPVHA